MTSESFFSKLVHSAMILAKNHFTNWS